jgi:hypothetical protein
MRKIFRCAIVQSIRTRTTSHDLDGRSIEETQASSRQVSKKIKKIKQIQKTERKALWTVTLAVTSQCRTSAGLVKLPVSRSGSPMATRKALHNGGYGR